MDPIRHWHALDPERNPLARMALDILSAPGMCRSSSSAIYVLTLTTATSVDVERLFSHGGLVVSKLRRNLSDESTRAATVLSEWLQVPGLVPKKAIVTNFKEKSGRSKGKGVAAAPGPVADDKVVLVE